MSLYEPGSPFRIAAFRAIWIANLGSNFGGMIQSVGSSWLMISLSASPQMVALVQTATTLPILLLSLATGAIADSFDRRRIMLFAQGLMFSASFLLVVISWLGSVTPWSLLGVTFLIGCGTALNGPAWQASVGDLVPRGAVHRAIAMNSMGYNMARSVGPALGGLIVAVVGAAPAFTVNMLSYVGLIVVLWRWQPLSRVRPVPSERIDRAIVAGVRFAAGSPCLRTTLLRALLFGFPGGAVAALLPVVARDLVGGGAGTYGLLLGGFGAGAILGALAGVRLRTSYSSELVVRGATLSLGFGAAIVATSSFFVLSFLALLMAGAGWVLGLSTFNTAVQLSTPTSFVARALSIYQIAAFGGMAAGSWVFGAIAEHLGVSIGLLIAAAVQSVGFIVGCFDPLPALDDDVDTMRE